MTWVWETIAYPAFLFPPVKKELPSMNQVSSRLGQGVSEKWGKGERRLDKTSEQGEWGLC